MPERGSRLIPLLALALVATALYALNLRDYFLGDDFDLIGSFFDRPLSYLGALLYSNESGEAWKSWLFDPALGRGYLRPVKIWLLAADFSLWSTNPLGYHLTSTACFVGIVLLVYLILERVLPGRPAVAFAGAFAAAVHPVFAEVVPFITAREELVSALFGLAAFYAFLRHRQNGASPRGFALFYGVALLSKESSLVLLVLPAAYDLAHGRLSPRRPGVLRDLAPVYAPVAAVLLVYFALRWIAFGNFVGGDGQQLHYSPGALAAYHLRLLRSLGDPTLLSIGAWPAGKALAAGLGLAPVLVLAVAARRIPKRRLCDLVFFGPLWYLGTTVLYSGVYFATRHHVVPVIGLALFAALAIGTLLDAGVLARQRLWAGILAGVAAVLFLPASLTTSLEYHAASQTVRRVRDLIERRTSDLPDGSRILIPEAPQLDLPPFYFGWGLLAALRQPFTPSDLADRAVVINPRNLMLTRIQRPIPKQWDRVVEVPPHLHTPDWIQARYRQRYRRDLVARR